MSHCVATHTASPAATCASGAMATKGSTLISTCAISRRTKSSVAPAYCLDDMGESLNKGSSCSLASSSAPILWLRATLARLANKAPRLLGTQFSLAGRRATIDAMHRKHVVDEFEAAIDPLLT